MTKDIKLSWDGETIKQTVNIPDKKFTPKEIIDSLDQVRGQISQMNEQMKQAEQQMKMLNKNIKQAKEFETERKQFEKKCIEIEKTKIIQIINLIHDECLEKANKETEKIINKDSNAYTQEHIKNQKYTLYQRFLATNDKMAKKISRRGITTFIFDTPIFNNPF